MANFLNMFIAHGYGNVDKVSISNFSFRQSHHICCMLLQHFVWCWISSMRVSFITHIKSIKNVLSLPELTSVHVSVSVQV